MPFDQDQGLVCASTATADGRSDLQQGMLLSEGNPLLYDH